MDLAVGQELWMVPSDARYVERSMLVKVCKVGRKWAELENYNGRVSIESGWIDGGKFSSPGRCWPSKEAWDLEQRRLAAWGELKSLAGGYSIPDLPESAIRQCIDILRRVNTR